jgi:hypothetical protein
VLAPVPAPALPVLRAEDKLAPPERYPEPPAAEAGGRAVALSLIASSLVLAGLIAAGFVWREAVMHIWPPSQRLFSWFGLG